MWVIVIDNSGGTSQSEVKLKLFLKNNKLYNVTKFANYNNLLEEYKYRCKVKVTHWNAMTGNYNNNYNNNNNNNNNNIYIYIIFLLKKCYIKKNVLKKKLYI